MSKVYFTKEITPESLIKIYNGEPGGNNYLKPELIKDLVSNLNGTIVNVVPPMVEKE